MWSRRFVLALLLALSHGCGWDAARFQGVFASDANVGVNSLHVVQAFNSVLGGVKIYNRFGTELAQVSLTGLTNCPGFVFDPRVRFDLLSNRWFVVATRRNPPGLCLAVSQTADPTGAWFTYFLGGFGPCFPDYPQMGLSENKLVLAGVLLTAGSAPCPDLGKSAVLVLNKAHAMAGAAVSAQLTVVASRQVVEIRQRALPVGGRG